MAKGTPEREPNNKQTWTRLERVLGHLQRNLQLFSGVGSKRECLVGAELYSVQRETSETDPGQAQQVTLLRDKKDSPMPLSISLHYQPDSEEIASFECLWSPPLKTEGITYFLAAEDKGRISRVAQIIKPEGLFGVADDQNQCLCAKFHYDQGGLEGVSLQLGYENGQLRTQAYCRKKENPLAPIEIEGRELAVPTLEQVVSALENILNNKKALVLEEAA
jgi:hypothetical protein